MIARLRRKLTLLVIAVLLLVTAGIIFAISFSTFQNVDRQAYNALRAMSRGQRFAPRNLDPDSTLPPFDDTASLQGRRFRGDQRGFEPELLEDDIAGLSNTYTIELNDDDTVKQWTSDRASLYTDDQVAALAARVSASNQDTGRVGSQYYCRVESGGSRSIVVLDARLQRLNAQKVLNTTALVAGLACALLSAAAWLLIGQMVKPVDAAFERQKQFVWDASHEFKTPLAVISANAEVLAGEIGQNEYLGYIQSEVRRTDKLVQNLLTLARMDKGTVSAEMSRFDLSGALLEVALPFESTVFEAGKTLETDIPDGITVKGDREMLQQLAVILLSNALKYSDDGGTIRISLAQKGHGCRLSVFNTGQGIAPENLERIFDRFYREDLSHNNAVSGNGLGLAIARNIVDAHKGKIHAESEYGSSAEFIVTLP